MKVTDDRRAVAAELACRTTRRCRPTRSWLRRSFLIGTVDEIAGQILRNRDRYGFTYYTVHEPFAQDLAPVIEGRHSLHMW